MGRAPKADVTAMKIATLVMENTTGIRIFNTLIINTKSNNITLDNKKAKRKQDPKADTRTEKRPGLGSQFGVFGAQEGLWVSRDPKHGPFFQ